MDYLLQGVTSGRIFYDYDNFEALHLLLTWLWICLGGLVQFIAVCCHLRFQNYLSLQERIMIGISSALLLGPSMIYMLCIGFILRIKLRPGCLHSAEKDLEEVINAALLFSSQAKLGEIVVESVPQLATQLLMTSLKRHVTALTPLQMASVVSSTISISLGISSYVINARGRYYSLKHCQMTSRIILTLLAALEIAFFGGICRFAGSFTHSVSNSHYLFLGACATPLVGVSFVLATLPIIFDKFQIRYGEWFFLFHRIIIWVTFIVLFFIDSDMEWKLTSLRNNNSPFTFLVTMTLMSLLNIGFGFWMHKQKSEAKIYDWVKSLLT